MINIKKTSILLTVTGLLGQTVYGQQKTYKKYADQLNTITTAVPFLMITPDSRAGGMGDVGCATSTDVSSIHWNPSKLGFADKKMAVGVSYTPWLRTFIPDITLAYLSGYYKTKGIGTFGGSFRYFSLGDITFTDATGKTINTFRPNEFALDAAYAVKLSDQFSVGTAIRYITSNLTGGISIDNTQTRPGTSFAVDISALYRKQKMEISDKKADFSAGLAISNIGKKMSYVDKNSAKTSNFIPINMRLGSALTMYLDDYNAITFAADANKLLVPTPPHIEVKNGVVEIVKGKDPNVGVAEGIFQSFNDAPGGSKEELREINYSVGLEYWYNKLFAVRMGYFYEHPTKGNRQFFTLGAGVKYNVFGLDFAYLIPTQQRNPLENTLRFSLTFDFDAFKAQNAASSESSAPASE